MGRAGGRSARLWGLSFPVGAELTDPRAPGGGEHSPVPASVAALRTVSGHSRPGQLCWPPARTACAPGPAGACPGAPCPAAGVTAVASPFSLDPWAHSPRLSLSPSLRSKARALVQKTSYCRPGPFPTRAPGALAGCSCCRRDMRLVCVGGCNHLIALQREALPGPGFQGGHSPRRGRPAWGPSPHSARTWLSSPSKRSMMKKRMDQNVGSGIIVTAFG